MIPKHINHNTSYSYAMNMIIQNSSVKIIIENNPWFQQIVYIIDEKSEVNANV